jgi:DNA-binding NtrC family response regulator
MKLLIAEDNDTLRTGISMLFRGQGHEVAEARDGAEALTSIRNEFYNVVITDVEMPGVTGMEVLRTALEVNKSTVVVIITAYGSVDAAVEAMRAGAADYIQKPFNLSELELKVQKALDYKRITNAVDYLRHREKLIYRFEDIVGQSKPFLKVIEIVKKVAGSNATVLVTGETGTGKEIIVGATHNNSPRRRNTLVKVNCAALQENLLESELFGHEKGAFTGADKQRIGRFEQADGGTIFLDEVGDMSPSTQAKVLRVLQEHEFERLGGTRTIRVDVRVVAATNRDLVKQIEEGSFREDLYYRLNVVSVHLPPLRERKDDIEALSQFFLQRFCRDFGKKVKGFHPGVIRSFIRYNWPGNIRELENTVERAVLMMEGTQIRLDHITLGGFIDEEMGRSSLAIKIPPAGISLEEVERSLLIEALKMSNWVQKDAAALLGISRRVINYKIKNHKITSPRWSVHHGSGEQAD